MEDPWGVGDPPAVRSAAPLPPRLARLAEVGRTGVPISDVDLAAWDFPRPAELPEVRALAELGWQPLREAPLYCLLPAAWPRAHRTWVPDRLPRVGSGGTTGTYYGSVVPLPAEDEGDDILEREAREAGLPMPPSGRIWLVRSPWPRLPVAAVYELVWAHTERGSGSEVAAVHRAARTVFDFDEATALGACPPALRALIEEWAAAGQVGEAAGPFVERRISPPRLARFMRRAGLDEARALAWLDSLAAEPDEDAAAFVAAWHSAGLPGDPPPGANRYRDRSPAELRRWLDAGFDLYAAHQLALAGLDTALSWRRAGFSEQDTYELLRDDPDLTPEQARAFDAGAVREQRRGWIYFGFRAAEAAAWAAAGITPSQARIWRACGRTPADVRPGRRCPPELATDRRYLALRGPVDSEYGPLETAWDELPDPPGTPGRRARRRAGDPHPWINID